MAAPALDRAAWASPWRSRSVGDKALLSLGLLGIAISAPAYPATLLVLATVLIVVLGFAKVPGRLFARALLAPWSFIVIGAFSVAITIGGSAEGALWSWGPLALSAESLSRAVDVLGRGFAGTAAMLLLAATTPIGDLLDALRRWRIPDPLIEIASLMYRLLFVLVEVTDQIRLSQTQRLGYHGFARSYRSLGLLLSTTLLRSWQRAQRLEDGLAGRGFDGSLRTLSSPRKHSATLVAVSLVVLAVVAVVSWWRWR